MIRFIRGEIMMIVGQQLVVAVKQLDIGVSIAVAEPHSFQVGQEVVLHTHMYWHQEQGPSLYGFETSQECEFFVLVIGCAGIGPKMALAMLQQMTVGAFVEAIRNHDVTRLSQLKGIGAKKAEHLILQLRDKILSFAAHQNIDGSDTVCPLKQAAEALRSLHYSSGEIQHAIAQVRAEMGGEQLVLDRVLRRALSFLSKKV
jgi:holliday junction DNA helicase RuvA